MGQNCRTELKPLVVDGGVLHTLVATHACNILLEVLPFRFYVTPSVYEEFKLQDGILGNGRICALEKLDSHQSEFLEMVSGSSSVSLADPDALAVIGASQMNCPIATDEIKIRTHCGRRYPHLRLFTSFDLLTHEVVRSSAQFCVEKALRNALEQGLMTILAHQRKIAKRVLTEELVEGK